jgi:hypothetical protein
MRGGRQKTNLGSVTAIHIGMRDSAEDGEIALELLEDLEIWGELVTPARLPGEETRLEQAQVVADGQHAPRRFLFSRECGPHRVQ